MGVGDFIKKGGALLIALALALLFGRFLLPALLPFILGGAAAAMLYPMAYALSRGRRIGYKTAAVITALVFYGLAALLLANLGFLIFAQGVSLLSRLPGMVSEQLLPAAEKLWQSAVDMISRFLPGAGDYMGQLSQLTSEFTGQALSGLSSGALHSAAAFVTELPGLIFNLFLTILSSVLILLDYSRIVGFIYRRLSPRMRSTVRASKSFLLTTGKNVIKAYLLLMLLTFCIVTVGLRLLGVEYFAAMGLVVALVDVLPVLGSGAVLAPWGLWQLVAGRKLQGVGILLLWGVLAAARAVAEPKLVGDGIGLPPLVTVLSMTVGLRLFGIAGLILTPMAVTLLVYLHKHDRLRLWKGGANQ